MLVGGLGVVTIVGVVAVAMVVAHAVCFMVGRFVWGNDEASH